MVLTMIAVSILLILLLEVNVGTLPTRVLGPYITQEQAAHWLEAEGYNRPIYVRYFEWIGDMLSGDFGESTRFREPVSDILWDRLGNTGILAFFVFAIMVPLSLGLGILSGMKEGSRMDRSISFLSVVTTSVPEFASAVLLSTIFVFALGWLEGTVGSGSAFNWTQMILPVSVLVLYGFGYIARMMRASMAEVMQSPYIRTAVLKGLPYRRVILRHALRNALIAPFTVIILQINWLLSGVIVVEFFFSYDGFGALLLEAAQNTDIDLIQACAMVAVVVAVGTQTIADIGYTYLNPRIRFT
ncbi:MAG: ABC transporter permease [Rhodospirillaceae bacterium]|nr:ABC transporter permease [Rhodospirillaceae bacterium]